MNKINVSAAILVGGKSLRFGEDKAFLRLEDDPVSIRIFRILDTIFREVFFVSGTEKKDMLENAVILSDLYPETGPLGGLVTALSHARYPYCFLTACDLPFTSSGPIRKLWQETGDNDITVPEWNGFVEPLFAFYHRRCTDHILLAIHTRRFMLKGFWQELNVKKVDMLKFYSETEMEKLFYNINTQDDYRKALEMIARG
jgi:molybdopterin-guanine dinucleotide biosynthesis protein A